jgi:hypothetical protein
MPTLLEIPGQADGLSLPLVEVVADTQHVGGDGGHDSGGGHVVLALV